MPSTSQAQQAVTAIAEHHPSKLYARNRGLLKMSKQQLHDFASTSTKGLPKRKRMANNSGIHIKPSHEGLLHRGLHVAEGHKIPLSKLMAGKRSKDPKVRRRATFAVNARGFNHSKSA